MKGDKGLKEEIILVDEMDNEIGFAEKLEVHTTGRLHRAFSIFVFNDRGELLLQKREKNKYHSAGLWSNTCCSHPRAHEGLKESVHRRLREEMGFDCELKEIHEFIYRSEFDNGLTEHEYDHVFVGEFNGIPHPDSEEVEDYKWISIEELKRDVTLNPDKYTVWFLKVYEEVTKKL